MSGRARFLLLGWLNAPPVERGTACGTITIKRVGGGITLTQPGGRIDLRPRIGGELEAIRKESRVGGDVTIQSRIGGTVHIRKCEESDTCE
jgi:hypothetical protein